MNTDFENAFQNEPVTFLLSNALRHLTQDQQRQLCNALQERLPIPASIGDEAESLYPIPESATHNYKFKADLQRSAHITCARQYTDTIEKLRAELEQSLLLYNNQTATIMKLQAENSKMRKALEGIAQKYADAEVMDDIGQFVFEMGELATEALK